LSRVSNFVDTDRIFCKIELIVDFFFLYFMYRSVIDMVRVMVFNATFNNISEISWRSVLL
jgi:hypothetical protein